jgi:hypothetical protein
MRTLSMHIVTYLIEYMGEFEFIFKTILDYESGDQMGSFDAKNPPSKISCLGTFKSVGTTDKFQVVNRRGVPVLQTGTRNQYYADYQGEVALDSQEDKHAGQDEEEDNGS